MDDQKIESIVRKVTALLDTNGCTEAEAESRVAKAQELLETYNLDMATLGTSDATRKDTKRKGGLYSWQRDLWKSVAEMNFCYYFSIKGLAKGSTYQHRILGSSANVLSTELMADYLQGAVERIAQTWAKENHYKSVFCRDAIAYREGMAHRISQRLAEKRDVKMAEAEEKRSKEEASPTGEPGRNALTILDISSSENDLNNDYIRGVEPGTTAAERARHDAELKVWRAKRAAEEAVKTPEDKAAEWEKWLAKSTAQPQRKGRAKAEPRPRALTAQEERARLSSFVKGQIKGESVGLDTQVNETKSRRIR